MADAAALVAIASVLSTGPSQRLLVDGLLLGTGSRNATTASGGRGVTEEKIFLLYLSSSSRTRAGGSGSGLPYVNGRSCSSTRHVISLSTASNAAAASRACESERTEWREWVCSVSTSYNDQCGCCVPYISATGIQLFAQLFPLRDLQHGPCISGAGARRRRPIRGRWGGAASSHLPRPFVFS